MNNFQSFKDEIDDILDDIDLLMYTLDNRSLIQDTVAELIDSHAMTVERLGQAFGTLKQTEGATKARDIRFEGNGWYSSLDTIKQKQIELL